MPVLAFRTLKDQEGLHQWASSSPTKAWKTQLGPAELPSPGHVTVPAGVCSLNPYWHLVPLSFCLFVFNCDTNWQLGEDSLRPSGSLGPAEFQMCLELYFAEAERL